MATINLAGQISASGAVTGNLIYNPAALAGTSSAQGSVYAIYLASISAVANSSASPPNAALSVSMRGVSVTLTRTVTDSIYPGDQFFPGDNALLDTLTSEDAVRFGPDNQPLYGGQWTGYDYEMPFGENIVYVAKSYDANGGLLDTVISGTVNVDPPRPWLIYPGNPGGSVDIRIQDIENLTTKITQGVFWPAGRQNAIVVSDRRQSATGSLEVYVDNLYDRDRVMDAVDLGEVLLLNVSPALGWDIPWQYIAVGEVVESRPRLRTKTSVTGTSIALLNETDRVIHMAYTVVERPVGLEASPPTWADLQMDQISWRTARSTYSSWSALITHIEFS